MNSESGLRGLRRSGTSVTPGRWPLMMISLLALLTSLAAGCVEPEPTPPSSPPGLATSVDLPLAASVTPPPASIGDIPASATPEPSAPTPTASPSITASGTPMPTARPTALPTSAPPTPTTAPVCTEVRGRIETGTFFSGVIGREQPYRVYLPPCYDFDVDRRYPVLYMLHGYPYDDAHWDDLGIDEAADAGIASGSLAPFIIAMPAADNEGTFTKTSGGPASFEDVVMSEFLPYIESRYRALATSEGRAIGGMSRGGVWSLEIAFRNRDRFSAVGGHSAALNVNLAGPAYNPLSLAGEPAIGSLRIYLDTGSGDWTLPGMEDLHAALTAAGVNHVYNLRDGVHSDEYWSEHVAEYLAFYAAEW